jgi:hypothetical protein
VKPPLPPTLGIPVKVGEMSAVERGDRLAIDFVAPNATTDAAVLKTLGPIDLRAGAAGPNWEANARRIDVAPSKPGLVHIEVPAAPWIGQSIEVRVRVAGKHGRFSQWSDPVRFKAIAPLAKPTLKIEDIPHGVRLSWAAAPGAEYRVFRLAPPELKPSTVAVVKTPEYADMRTEYGKTYVYSVQAFAASGNSEAQSDTSQPAPFTPTDRFPPPVPAGLAAVAGVSSVELNWTPDSDPDLRGYYVYRSVNGGPFERAGELLTTPSYSDRAVEAGKHYRYAVAAVGVSGHESERSPAVEMTAQ